MVDARNRMCKCRYGKLNYSLIDVERESLGRSEAEVNVE